MERSFFFMGVIIAILLLVAGYLYKGIPLLVSLLVGYYFIYKGYLRKLEREEEMRQIEMEKEERYTRSQ